MYLFVLLIQVLIPTELWILLYLLTDVSFSLELPYTVYEFTIIIQ